MPKNGNGREIPDLDYIRDPDRLRRFFSLSTPGNTPDECRIWIGTQTRRGYGIFQIIKDGRRYRIHAHRISWAIDRGRYPSEKSDVHHKCGNPLCINPIHLCTTSPKVNASKNVPEDVTDVGEDELEAIETGRIKK